jgi:type I restriction enzyme S subunit
LIKKFEKIDYYYILYILQNEFKKHNFNWENKPTVEKIKNITIPIPYLPNGEFDIEIQQEIVEKYNIINELKTKAKEYEDQIKNLIVKIDDDLSCSKPVQIKDIFTTKKGFSKYTKSYGQLHKGEYPVYSGSNIAPIMFIDTYDYEGEYLSWVVDGFAGYMKVLKGKFSATGHKGILTLKSNNIDIDYVKFILEPILRDLAKGRKGDKGSSEYTNVASSVVENAIIRIPTLHNGDFDLEAQQEIARKYKKIEEIKVTLQNEFTKIQNISINISM